MLRTQDGFLDFDMLYSGLLFISYIDIIIFGLLPISFMKQLITWVPWTFKPTTDLLITYINTKQLLLTMFSLYATFAVSCFNKFVMATILYKIGSPLYSMLRTMVFNLNGFFWEPTVTFGIQEGVERVIQSKGIILTLFCIFAVRMISQYIIFNMMVSQILDYLKTSRFEGIERDKIARARDERLVEAEIHARLKK